MTSTNSDVHQYRDESPVDIAQFYGAVAACQLGEAMLDKEVRDYGTVMDLVQSRSIETVLLLMVGTTTPQKPLRRDSPEIESSTTSRSTWRRLRH
jgi:hypothetical protein